ncbi:N-acetyl-gamma-glutamyl-phosphate reductase [Desulfovibrio inopinatus]|uniref:N-acetyl-gamma-glutamyl-phosphate reductase n=1 Tax=Desulfovibrio inopinatus TaxID=102109 RepID=UPI000415BC5B|nr:N-acetyl-gamma-glutamyl-phosphate reductase [Desulfovibrio inopinatus]
MSKIPVGLVGVTGYTGMELARLLAVHPHFELVRATSRSEAGKSLGELYPFLAGFPIADIIVSQPDADDLGSACQIVFLAVPHCTAMRYAKSLLDKGLKVVDLSADFRLKDQATYESWYATKHEFPELLQTAVYGLPERYADDIAKASLVANPGCYPTSIILGLAPALENGLISTGDIIADSKSGASGAGRKASVGTLFCEVHDSFRAYNLGKHRHTPEIEQELSVAANTALTVSFNPHLLPIDRGILSTIYTKMMTESSTESIYALYTAAYKDKPWVRVLPPGRLPETRNVRGTMFCDIGLTLDPRTKRLIITSTIDNLCRGASGQALANANLMAGFDITAGLNLAPLMP